MGIFVLKFLAGLPSSLLSHRRAHAEEGNEIQPPRKERREPEEHCIINHDTSEERARSIEGMSSPQFIIVGAGVSGLYAAYRLQQSVENCRITVIERLPRMGGRILTEKYEGHIMEYGPMRFEPELQKTFARLISELNLQTKVFSPYSCDAAPDFNKLELEEIQAIKKYSKLSPVFALLKYGLSKVLEDQWNVDEDDMRKPGRDAKKVISFSCDSIFD